MRANPLLMAVCTHTFIVVVTTSPLPPPPSPLHDTVWCVCVSKENKCGRNGWPGYDCFLPHDTVLTMYTYAFLAPWLLLEMSVNLYNCVYCVFFRLFFLLLLLYAYRDDLAFDLHGYIFVLLNNVASAANSEFVRVSVVVSHL